MAMQKTIEKDDLLAVLGCGIVIGLFFYLKFFFLAVVLLVLGANLDQTIAEHLNVSKIPLILAMVAIVGTSLINYVFKLLPTGLQTKPRSAARRACARASTTSRRANWCTR